MTTEIITYELYSCVDQIICEIAKRCCSVVLWWCKIVNGSRYYRALESVSIASALSSTLAIYPCHIRVHQR